MEVLGVDIRNDVVEHMGSTSSWWPLFLRITLFPRGGEVCGCRSSRQTSTKDKLILNMDEVICDVEAPRMLSCCCVWDGISRCQEYPETRRWEGWISYVGANEDDCHVGRAGAWVQCVDGISRRRAGTIKRESANADPGAKAARCHSGCHKICVGHSSVLQVRSRQDMG